MAFDLFNTIQSELLVDSNARTVSVIPQLSQKDYAQVKTLLNRIGGVWNKQNQNFDFKKCPQSLIDRLLSVGSRRLNQFHFYPTPEEVFEYFKVHTPLKYFGAARQSVRTLEPSCGEGSLIRQLLKFGEEEGRNFIVEGYDIDPLNVIFCQESGLNVTQADFLKVVPTNTFEMVVMNPPFMKDEFIKHIKHAQKFLTTDGILISVVPTKWISDHIDHESRHWLFEQAQIESSGDLDSGNFYEPGTFKGVNIPTAIICLPSAEAAERTLASPHYKAAAIDSFRLYVECCTDTWNKLHKMKMDDSLSPDVVIEKIQDIVTKILRMQCNDTVHLVHRFTDNYVLDIVEEWFPQYLYKLVPPTIPEQLDMMAIFDSPLNNENKVAA